MAACRGAHRLERHPQYTPGAMHKNVETLLGRLVTDPELHGRFARDPEALLGELRDQGFELTEVEREALALTDPDAIRAFAEALDRRIRKAVLD
jgi:hypothetical protein